MNLLTLILSAVMTWTVNTKSKVSTEDPIPSYLEAQYACTYQKGDVRAGDTATLLLSSLQGMTIEQIEIYLKSNKSSGAGSISVEADNASIAGLTGTFKDWTGAYDNTEYHPISLLQTPVPNVNELSIALIGSVNSLHIEKYVIQYALPQPKTVTLMKGNEVFTTLSEETSGSGIVLPSMPDEGEWHFTAWSSHHFYEMDDVSASWLIPVANVYYPTGDETLWAVYKSEKDVDSPYATSLEDGLYCYVDTSSMNAMLGRVLADGYLENALWDPNDVSQLYDIEFDATGETAVIYHPQSDTYVGYSGATLTNDPSIWKVYHNGAQTAFYTEYSGHTYVLWPSYLRNPSLNVYFFCTDLIPASDLSLTTTALISSETMEEGLSYTCHPEIKMSVEQTLAPSSNEYTMPIGNYRLIIRGGQKILKLQPYETNN